MAPAFEAQLRPLPGRQAVEHLGDGLGVGIDGRHHPFGGPGHAVQQAVRWKASTQVDAGHPVLLCGMELLAQGQQFGHGHAVGIGIEDVGADVGVQRVQRELRVRLDAVGSARRLAVFHGKAEFRPDRPDAGIEPDADTHLQWFIEIPGQGLDEAELVPVVDLDQRPLANGLLQDRTRLERPVEDDVLAPDAELAGLLVFKV
ncbi:hypothetical protein D9M69_517880 [compost metagenome]